MSEPRHFLGLSPVFPREAALCFPAMPLMMLASVATGDIATGAIATGAAFSVGFGAGKTLFGWRWGAMVSAALAMTAATFVGIRAGNHAAWALPVNALAAAWVAWLALKDEDRWWMALQAMIALLVAEYYPGGWAQAATRSATVLGGGLFQMGSVLLLARLFPHAAEPLPRGQPLAAPSRGALWGHMIRAGLCVSVALPLAWRLGLANSYWAPMTGMLVLKPGLRDTYTRGLNRIGGTLLGCVAATLFVVAARGEVWVLVSALGVGVAIAFAIQKAHYAALTLAITWVVVMLQTIAHGGVIANAEHRILATLLGGGLALACATLAPRRPAGARRLVDRVGELAALAPGRLFR